MALQHYTSYLQQIEDGIKARYEAFKVGQRDVDDAAKLSRFFQILKQMSINKMSDKEIGYRNGSVAKADIQFDESGIFSQQAMEVIWNMLPKNAQGNISNLFFTIGGTAFEHQLDTMLTTILSNAAADPSVVEGGLTHTGAVTAQTLGSNLTMTALADDYAKRTMKRVADVFRGNANLNQQLVIQNRALKVDNQGVTITYNTSASPELIEIASLLSQAKFTAKNYTSRSWQDGLLVPRSKYESEIGFGATNLFKALFSSIKYLGLGDREAARAVFGGLNAIGSGSPRGAFAQEVFSHLRLMYEISGTGQFLEIDGQRVDMVARFLIYNDPTGQDIYVVSTGQLIYEAITQQQYNRNNLFGEVRLSKNLIRGLNK